MNEDNGLALDSGYLNLNPIGRLMVAYLGRPITKIQEGAWKFLFSRIPGRVDPGDNEKSVERSEIDAMLSHLTMFMQQDRGARVTASCFYNKADDAFQANNINNEKLMKLQLILEADNNWTLYLEEL